MGRHSSQELIGAPVREMSRSAGQSRSATRSSASSASFRTSTSHSRTQPQELLEQRSVERSDKAGKQDAPEELANRSTQDRVHAWYRAHAAAPASQPLSSAASPHDKAPSLDVSPVARKASADDFDRAAAAQRQTIRAAAEQNERQTTADDDKAAAESHIPSTAPTEREPAPFQHGDAPASPPRTHPTVPPVVHPFDPAGAPVVREAPTPSGAASIGMSSSRAAIRPQWTQPQETAKTLARSSANGLSAGSRLPAAEDGQSIATTIPAHANLGPQNRNGSNTPPANRPEPRRFDSAVLATSPIATAADSSSGAVRAVAAETAASATPRIVLPAPPATAAQKPTPAIAAVQSNARRPQLDSNVASALAEETFDSGGTGGDAPVTAKSAVSLATAGPALSPGAAVRKAQAAEIDDIPPAASAALPVNLFDTRGHLILVAPMKGSHEILVHQNQMAVADGLERVQDDGQLAEMRRMKLLAMLPDDDSIYPEDHLPANRRYARPWTVRFLRDLSRAHYARFGTPLVVTSAVRTVEFQRRLVRVNGNAAPPTGDIASPHLYGQAVDIAKSGMSLTEIMWMRAYLTPVEADGKIDVEEEFQQSCFHLSVYRRYLGTPIKKNTPAAKPAPQMLEAKSGKPDAAQPAKKHRLPTALLATHLP